MLLKMPTKFLISKDLLLFRAINQNLNHADQYLTFTNIPQTMLGIYFLKINLEIIFMLRKF